MFTFDVHFIFTFNVYFILTSYNRIFFEKVLINFNINTYIFVNLFQLLHDNSRSLDLEL